MKPATAHPKVLSRLLQRFKRPGFLRQKNREWLAKKDPATPNQKMRFLTFFAAFGLFTFTCVQAQQRMVFQPGEAQPDPKKSVMTGSDATPEVQAEAFFRLLREGNVELAYENLTKGTIIQERREDVNALIRRTQQALDAYGDIAGFEVLETRRAGRFLVRLTCLSLNQDLPLRWRFYFYNSGGVWRLIDIRIDDGLMELFDDSTVGSERGGRRPGPPPQGTEDSNP
jgi:hypothetical protein